MREERSEFTGLAVPCCSSTAPAHSDGSDDQHRHQCEMLATVEEHCLDMKLICTRKTRS